MVMKMAKPYYVKFQTPEELVSPIYEALRVATQSGKVRKGTNEATKAIERGTSKLIVIAEDVEPPEVVAQLGKALGIDITSAAAAILDSGDAQHIVDQVISSISKIKGGKSDQ